VAGRAKGGGLGLRGDLRSWPRRMTAMWQIPCAFREAAMQSLQFSSRGHEPMYCLETTPQPRGRISGPKDQR